MDAGSALKRPEVVCLVGSWMAADRAAGGRGENLFKA